LAFVDRVKSDLGMKAMHREFEPLDDGFALREPSEPYARAFTGENDALRSENTIDWDVNAATADT